MRAVQSRKTTFCQQPVYACVYVTKHQLPDIWVVWRHCNLLPPLSDDTACSRLCQLVTWPLWHQLTALPLVRCCVTSRLWFLIAVLVYKYSHWRRKKAIIILYDVWPQWTLWPLYLRVYCTNVRYFICYLQHFTDFEHKNNLQAKKRIQTANVYDWRLCGYKSYCN